MTRKLLVCVFSAALASGCVVGDIEGTESGDEIAESGDDITNPTLQGGGPLTLVSLGASTSVGVTFDPGVLGLPGSAVIADNAVFPRIVRDVERLAGITVNYRSFAKPGATSSEVLNQQLPRARRALQSSRRVVVAVEAGGNDLRAFQVQNADVCLSSAPADQLACLNRLDRALADIRRNVDQIIRGIRSVNPRAFIVLQTQYSALYDTRPDGVDCAPASLIGLGDIALEGRTANGDPVQGLNPRLRAFTSRRGVRVADVAARLYGSGRFDDPSILGRDCTHLAGRRDAIPALGLAADTRGAGYNQLYQAYRAAVTQ